MITLESADISCIPELIKLLKVCFGEIDSVNELFVSYGVNDNQCLIIKKNNKIISSLYLIKAGIIENHKIEPIYYIYAACTDPEHRRKGVMTLLLNFANNFSYKNNCKYIVLIPSSLQKYNYYEKRGYKKFFKIREVIMSYCDIKNFLKFNNFDTSVELIYDKIYQTRKKHICSNGDVVWGRKHIEFSENFLNVCDGKVVFSNNGYAYCLDSDEYVMVSEIIVDNEDCFELIKNISVMFGDRNYRFRLPVNSGLFKGLGIIQNYGMIKSVFSREACFSKVDNPYLGLSLN